jgi:hypothetical protein
MKPLPKTNKTEHKSRRLFEIKAITNALSRIEFRLSDSSFSFEKTRKPKPQMNSSMINSSAN